MEEYNEEYCSLDNVLEKLKQDGVAVIPNVISKKNIKLYKKQLWELLYNLTKNLNKPIKKNDQTTWRTLWELFPLHSMLIQNWGIGHSKLHWNIRQEPKVIKVFSKIWGVNPEELLTSFDGMSFHFPPEVTNRGYYRGNDWFHTDQSRSKNKFCCVQGMVTLYDINDGDATFRCMKKSNNIHQQFFKDHPEIESTSDWFKLKKDHLNYFDKYEKIKIKAKKGSLILWDSRTFHQGIESLKERPKPNFRSVIYVCMTPRSFSTEKELKKKKKAFRTKRTTSHWPHKIWLFPKLPRTYGKKIADINVIDDKLQISDLGMKLAGF